MPSSAWEVAPATADDAAKGTPSGKWNSRTPCGQGGQKGHGWANGDHSYAAVIYSLEDSREVAWGHDFDRGHDQGSKLQPKS